MTSWFSATLETTILIDAPPEKVREVVTKLFQARVCEPIIR
jgi:hypothetical protein